MSLRWRVALGFAIVALVTAAVVALAAPPIVNQGFSELETEIEGNGASPAPAQGDDGESGVVVPPATTPGQAQQNTIVRLVLAAGLAAAAASLLGLLVAGRLVRPLTRLENAAGAVARGDLSQRSGLAGRSDEFGRLGRTFDSMASDLQLADDTRRRFLQDTATNCARRWR